LNQNGNQRSPRRGSHFGAAVFLSLLLYQLSTSSFAPYFSGFGGLRWRTTNSCRSADAPPVLPAYQRSAGDFSGSSSESITICVSEAFSLLGPVLEIEYASQSENIHSRLVAQLHDESGALLDEKILSPSPLDSQLPNWSTAMLTPGARHSGAAATITVRHSVPGNRHGTWFAVRDRVNFYHPARWHDFTPLGTPGMQLALCLLAGFFLFIWAKRSLFESPLSAGRFGLMLFVFGCAVHFRAELYFFWDEWHVLERFSKLGFPGVLYTHNEHFLPFFFSLYFVEAKLLGEHYLLYLTVSAALHAFNAFLVSLLLERLSGSGGNSRPAARLLGLLYLLSALHAEVLHWAFEQSILCAQALVLLALLNGLAAVEEGSFRKAVFAAIFAGLAPFFFGNGFAAVIQLPLLLGLSMPLSRARQSPHSVFALLQERIRRGFVTMVLVLLALVVPALLYYRFRDGVGTSVMQARPFANPLVLFQYLGVGSQLGTVLRGIGLFPSLDMESPTRFVHAVFPWLPVRLRVMFPSFIFAYLGLAVSLFCLGLSMCAKTRCRNFSLWLLGQLLIISAMLLPAFGRWQLGIDQSLSLRYHSQAALGLCIMVLPALLVLLTWRSDTGRMLRPLCKFCSVLIQALCVLHISAQLYLAQQFKYFTKDAVAHRVFAQQVRDWRQQLKAAAPSVFLPYEAPGTPLGGLQPRFPFTITLARHPDEIYRVLEWLK